VSEEDRGIPFFQKVDEFIEKLKVSSTERGYLQTPKGRRIPLGWIEQPTAQKYFNYLLQATETEFNIEVMKKLKEEGLPLPILYVYDSFLFEFPTDGDTNVVKGIKSVLESFGFPIKASWGMDYSKV
jgi:DNA polymerase I-like protein with 3'-5' exonuclease and polymerase domains